MMVRLRRLRSQQPDGGFTLVELLVVSSLVLIVLPLAGALLHSAVVAQRDVTSVTEAGTAVQTVASSVEAGVRNAAAMAYTRSGTDSADELLVTRSQRGSATGATTWVCQGWFYAAAEDALYTRTTPADGTVPAISAPTAATLPQWSRVATGVLPRAGAPGLLTPTPNLRTVDLEATVLTGTDRPAATISTSVSRRPQGQSKGAPCF